MYHQNEAHYDFQMMITTMVSRLLYELPRDSTHNPIGCLMEVSAELVLNTGPRLHIVNGRFHSF